MAFSFGGAPAPAAGSTPAPAPATGGAFSFGAAPAPGPASGAPAPAPSAPAPATGGFSFGGGGNGTSTASAAASNSTAPTGNASVAPTAATGGFSFGGGSGSTPAPATATGVGFTLGGSAPAPAPTAPVAPGTTSSTAPAPAAGEFSFGGSTTTAPAASAGPGATATTAPAPGTSAVGFGFGGAAGSTSGPNSTAAQSTAATGNSSSATAAVPNANPNAIVVPEFESLFPHLQTLTTVRRLLQKVSGSPSSKQQPDDDSVYAGQELLHILQCNSSSSDAGNVSKIGQFLSSPKPVAFQARDDGCRQKIHSNPTVILHGKEAGLTIPLMQEIFELADDLRISELHAMSLYAKASESDTRQWLERHLASSVASRGDGKSPSTKLGNNVAKAARELFFLERSSGLTSLLILLQHRNYENPILIQATDQLIDCNLVDNLVAIIKDYSQLANGLEQELAQQKANSVARTTMVGGFAQSQQQQQALHPEQESFGKILLNFAYQQRQLAATCLFYLTYNTQAKVQEIASIIDLIQKLTNGTNDKDGLPVLDPFTNVPSVFEGQRQPTQQSYNHQQPLGATPFTQALPPLKEKDPLQWQKEFVKSQWEDSGGKPELLQCVAVLCMAVISALNCRQILFDRNSHGPNQFGVGNAILPPVQANTANLGASPETAQLGPIHSRLDPSVDPQKNWKRKDIWGLLAASYALLLRPAATAVASPRLGSNPPSIDIKKTWRACLEVPTAVKSFTFARLSLVPSFPRNSSVGPDRNCNDYEFYMSVISEFTSQYLQVLCESADVPISRKKWKNDEQTELDIQKGAQERLRQFSSWSGTNATAEDESTRIPESVDLLKRPDTMDDIMALAVAVCSAGPEYANNFWSVEEEEVQDTSNGTFKFCRKLTKSTALTMLERIQSKDTSLLPAYVSFLGALALAEDPESGTNGGAAVVHKILSEPSGGAGKITWASLISVIRWFVRQMSTSEYDSNTGKSVSSTDTLTSTSSTLGSEPTAYYYGADRRRETTSSASASLQSGHASTTTTSDSSDSTKPKELGEDNTMVLLSYLNVISSVASNCKEARLDIISIALPLEDSAGEDPVLTILFSLAMCPLSPQLRGAVFVAISSLLRTNSPSKDEKDWARKAWGLLEESQTLPITTLYQFGQTSQGATHVSNAGLRFPPSSTGQVGASADGQYATPWMPPDTKLGILYEMEQVESRMGFYPSTEGFLHLLTTLVSVGGCPSDLGQYWRPRSGCSPYIEYVVHFVLPRSLGIEKRDCGLQFRTLADKSRLISLALEVVHAVVSRYSVPASTGDHHSVPALTEERHPARRAEQMPSEVFGLSAVDSTTFVTPNVREEKDYDRDYRDVSVETMHSTFDLSLEDSSSLSLVNDRQVFFDASSSVQSNLVAGEASFPAPKSPGFAILADIFSTMGGKLFQSLVHVMTDQSASHGIYAGYGLPEYKAAVANALFGETAPTFPVTKMYESRKKSLFVTKASLLCPPFPSGWQSVYDSEKGIGHRGSAGGVFWRERSIVLSLRILCAAAAREEKFVQAVNSTSIPLKIVPVIRFQKLGALASGIEAVNVQVSRLVDLMAASSGIVITGERRVEAVPTIVQYISYEALSAGVDEELASSAMALFVYINRSLPMQDSLRLLCSDSIDGAKSLAASISQRLDVSSKRAQLLSHHEMVDLILDLILRDLRAESAREMNMSHVLLGFPVGSLGDEWEPTNIRGTRDCLSLILDLLSDAGFLQEEKTLGFMSKCYELIYRLTTTKNIDQTVTAQRVLYVAGKLRSMSFWRNHLLRFLGQQQNSPSILETISCGTDVQEGSDHLVHCVAWLFKGVANELRMLMGLPIHGLSRNHPLFVLASPQYSKCRDLLSLLYGGSFKLAINALECLPLAKRQIISETSVPSSAVVKASVCELKGAVEVTQGWSIVGLDKLVKHMFLHHGKGHTITVESALKWAKQWNKAVAWECAVSHLADSFRVFISSSFVYCKILLIEDGSATMNAMSVGVAPLDTRGVVQLISLVLLQMTPQRQNDPRANCMDDTFYSSTTLSLSLSVFSVVEELMSILKSLKVPVAEGDALRISELIAGAIATSANTGGICQSSQQRERTAILGSTLALVMQFVCDNENSGSGLVSSGPERTTLIRAAMVLSKLACNPVNGLSASEQTSEQFAAVALTSRSALSALFRGIDDDAATRKESFIAQTFEGHTETLALFAQLVRTLDNNICLLLEQISMRRFGTEILQDAGILRALVDAADNYKKEEARVKEGFHVPLSNVQSYGRTRIGTPAFFSGHLSLLNSMLATAEISSDRRFRIAENSALFLQHNADVINRLLSEFPSDGDVTKELMRCLFLTLGSLAEVDKPDVRPPIGSSDYGAPGRLLRDSTYANLEHRVLELCYHLSQYPFPQRLLPSLPPNLNSTQYRDTLERPVVSVTTTEQRTWWDMVESTPHPMQKEMAFPPTGPSDLGGWQIGSSSDDIALRWSDIKYELSIDTAGILEACLSYLNQRIIVSPLLTLDWYALAKGFCRCADAARSMEGRLRNHSSPDELTNSMFHAGIGDVNQKEKFSQSSKMEKQYLSILGPLLGRCSEKILYLAVGYSRLLSREALSEKTRKSIIDLSTAILATLDHTRVEHMGLGCVGMAEDEERRDGTKKVASNLRKMLESQLKQFEPEYERLY